MPSDSWQQLEVIFQTALDLAPAERASYLAEACGNNEELRHEAEALLAQYEEAGNFLDEPLLELSGLRALASLGDDDPVIGQQIGAYKVVRQIGRGGMGAVYLAERADNAFQKQVAIKLIKRGMDTDFILRRFRHERQILAALDHPYIARLLDGGATESGQPYFVMDYIEGEPLYRHCDGRRLNVPERLRLFAQVCEAVEYAHQKQVIHRDIKPSNILVSAERVPKLFDFGIAKLLNPALASDTNPPTATAMRLMTVEYSSPEQVQGLEVTYRSDVYSLGVLLYELLTGHRPYHFRSRQLHEMAQAIVAEAPEPPSAAVAHVDNLLPVAGAESESATVERVCELRSSSLAGLSRELTGNLDRIVMRALRKEPRERYPSAAALREDIILHLEGGAVSAPSYSSNRRSRPTGLQHAEAKSIAVLPLKILNLSPNMDTGDKFMSVGLADALITKLSGVRRLAVRPTSAILRYGDEGSDPLTAGRELGVDFVLDGRIKIVGERIRVSLQLLEVESATSVWAHQFDERYTDVLELEDSISAKVGDALLPELTEGEREQLKKRGTDNPKAFEAYMRGRYFWNQFTPESLAKVIESFQEAIRLDPNYALPYVGIADFYNWASIYGMMPASEASSKARALALRALELDADLGEAYAALGQVAASQFEWAEAERLHRKALELSPSHSLAHEWYGSMLTGIGRFEEGLKECRRAQELDPLSPRTLAMAAWFSYQNRHFTEALATTRQVLERDKDYPLSCTLLGNCLERMDRAEEGVAALERAVQLMPDSTFPYYFLCYALVAAGRRDRAREVLHELKTRAEKGYVKPYFLAMAHAALDERDAAFEWFEKAFAERDHWLLWLCTEPKLDPLRGDPRFVKLIRQTQNPLALQQAPLIEEAPTGGEKNIAVLPLKLLGAPQSGGTGDEYLGFGLADSLITRLSQLDRFVVRPTSSVLHYSNHRDAFAAGKELGVEFVVDGTVRSVSGRIRVTAQLLSVREGTTLWAEQFDEQQADLLELEDSISQKIVESLTPQLTSDARRRLEKRATDNPKAFEAYMRGRYLLNHLNPESLSKGVDYFQAAIKLDRNYAMPYAEIAAFYNWAGIYGLMPPGEAYPKAKAAALRALELDADLGEAYAALGLIAMCQWDWAESERLYLKALELSPNNAQGHEWYSSLLVATGRWDEATKEMRRVMELDPISPLAMALLAWNCYQARQFDEARAWAQQIIDLDENFAQGYIQLGDCLEQMGRPEESVAALEKSMRLMPESAMPHYKLCYALVAAGRRDRAREVLHELKTRAEKGYVKPYFLAMAHAALDELDAAFKLFERAFAEQDQWLMWCGTEPKLDPLRTDSRFQELFRKLNNPLTLPTGARPDFEEGSDDRASRAELPRALAAPSARQRRLGALVALALVVVVLAAVAAIRYFSSRAQPPQQITGLAVLPFANTTGNSEFDYLGDGLAESLINDLSQLPGLKVSARSSSFKYKGREVAPPEAVKALGVGALVRGRLMRAGEQLQLSVELVGADGRQLWGRQYSASTEDLLQAQAEISRALAEVLTTRATAEGRPQLVRAATANQQAYNAWLRARFYWHKGGVENWKKAIEWYGQAVAADPAYAQVYAEMSDTYRLLVIADGANAQAHRPKALEMGHKALEINDTNAEAHAALARLKLDVWDWSGAEQSLKRAVDLNPNNVRAHSWYARCLSILGRHDEALTEAQRGRELDPLSPLANAVVGEVLHHAGRYQEALESIRQTMDNSSPLTHLNLGFNYLGLENYAEAATEFQETAKLGINDVTIQVHLGIAYAKAGERDRAQAILQQMQKRDEQPSPIILAALYEAMGMREQALALLERAYEARDRDIYLVAVRSVYNSLRSDPRFQDLMRRIGLPLRAG